MNYTPIYLSMTVVYAKDWLYGHLWGTIDWFPGANRDCIECELITLCTYKDALCKPYVTENGVQWLQPERVGSGLEVL